MEVLDELCFLEIFITSKINFLTFGRDSIFFKSSGYHVMAVTEPTIKINGVAQDVGAICLSSDTESINF